MKTRKCIDCGEAHPSTSDYFHRHNGTKSNKDKLNPQCKLCRNQSRRVSGEVLDISKEKYEEGLKINKLTETESAYIAGFIDGEGCIGLSDRGKEARKERDLVYIMKISISNTNRDVLEWIRLRIGHGSIYVSKKTKGHKQSYQWTMVGRRCVDLLEWIYPYLKVKRLQAEVLFEFAETMRPPGNVKFWFKEDALVERQVLKNRITDLNMRGSLN